MSPSSAYLRYQVRVLVYLALPTRPYPRTCTFIVFFRLLVLTLRTYPEVVLGDETSTHRSVVVSFACVPT